MSFVQVFRDRERRTLRRLALLTTAIFMALMTVSAFVDGEEMPSERRLQVGFLIVDGVYNSELMAPYDIFQHTIFHTEPGMEVFTVSPDGEDVTSFEGLRIGAHYSLADAPPIDVLVVPSAEHSMDSDLENRADDRLGPAGRLGRPLRHVAV